MLLRIMEPDKRLDIKNIPTYGKTGTSSAYKDAWFIGHAGNKDGITATSWIGNDNYYSMDNATGGSVATLLWRNILENYFKIHPRNKETGFGINLEFQKIIQRMLLVIL